MGPTRSLLTGQNRVFSDGTHVFVVDMNANRVLIWNSIPSLSGSNASLVLGQPDFISSGFDKSASGMSYPWSAWSDGTRVAVADTGNNRVLIWTSFPTTNGQPADIELGWSDFGLGSGDAVKNPPDASSLALPADVLFDGKRFFVVDWSNHRVLVWNGFPNVNGQPATFVIGQPNLTQNKTNAGSTTVNAAGLNSPRSIAEAYGSLFVDDEGNDRVLVYTPTPISTGTVASAVLGQASLTTTSTPSGALNTNIGDPLGLDAIGNYLYVSDSMFNRVLRFTLTPK
jgi:hypothetical protein